MTDGIPELDDDDLRVLSEALEAWEQKDTAADLIGHFLTAAMGRRGNPELVEEMERQEAAEHAARQRAAAVRKERSVLLRAKLIAIRRRREVDRVRP